MNWPVVKLDDICRIELGKTPSRGDAALWDKDRTGSNIWLSIADLPFNLKPIMTDSKEYISDKGAKLCRVIPAGTLIVSFKLSLGRLAYAGKDLFSNEAIAALYVEKNIAIAKDYLYWALTNFDWDKAVGSDIKVKGKTLNKAKLKEIPIPLPPIPEQQRIVAILDQAFADIEKARANAEQNLKNARKLFDSYLDAICSRKSSLPSQLIGDVCSLYQGIAINKKTKHVLVEKSSLPLLRIKDLKNNTQEQYVSEQGYPPNSRVFEDDILYTRTGSLGLVFRGRNGVLHNNSFKVVPNDLIDKNYLFWWLQHASFKAEIMQLALKAAQPDITHAIFKIQAIEIPLLTDQKKSVVNIERQKIIVDDLAGIYKRKLLALDELKKSLLQKAFSGELTKSKGIAA